MNLPHDSYTRVSHVVPQGLILGQILFTVFIQLVDAIRQDSTNILMKVIFIHEAEHNE